jgi:ankyrin repeat protein
LAAKNGHAQTVKFLALYKANLNARQKDGKNANGLALENYHTPTVKMLNNAPSMISDRNKKFVSVFLSLQSL